MRSRPLTGMPINPSGSARSGGDKRTPGLRAGHRQDRRNRAGSTVRAVRSQGCPGRSRNTAPITGRMNSGIRLPTGTAAVPGTGTPVLLGTATAVLRRNGTADRIPIGTAMCIRTHAGKLARISTAARELTNRGPTSVAIRTQVRARINSQVPVRISHGVRAETSSAIRVRISSGIRVRISRGVRAEMSSGIRVRISRGVRAEMSSGIRVRISRGVRAEMSSGIRVRISRGVREETSTGIRVRISRGVRAETSTGISVRLSSGIHVRISSGIHVPNRLAGHEPTSSRVLASRAGPISLADTPGINGSTTAKTCSRPIGKTSSVTSRRLLAGLGRPKTVGQRRAGTIRRHRSRRGNSVTSGTSAARARHGRPLPGLHIPACPSESSCSLASPLAGPMGCQLRPTRTAGPAKTPRTAFTPRESPTAGRPPVMVLGQTRTCHPATTARRVTRA
jgi:hypothetical protein